MSLRMGALQMNKEQVFKAMAILSIGMLLIIGIEFYDNTKPQEDYWESANILCEEGFSFEQFKEEFEYIPQPIVQRFNDRNWSIILGDSKMKEYKMKTGRSIGGCTDFDTNIIWTKLGIGIIHEMGHFYHNEIFNEYGERILECYEAEGNTKINEATTNYSMISCIEYFPEFFSYYLRNYDNKEVMESLKERKPMTFALFEELREKNWCISDNRMDRLLLQLEPEKTGKTELQKFISSENISEKYQNYQQAITEHEIEYQGIRITYFGNESEYIEELCDKLNNSHEYIRKALANNGWTIAFGRNYFDNNGSTENKPEIGINQKSKRLFISDINTFEAGITYYAVYLQRCYEETCK